jgi:hypothetical protein
VVPSVPVSHLGGEKYAPGTEHRRCSCDASDRRPLTGWRRRQRLELPQLRHPGAQGHSPRRRRRLLLPAREEVPEPEPKKAQTPSMSRTFKPDSGRDAEAAQLVRRQIDDAGGEAEKPVSYLFFRFGVQKRVPGVCKYIGDCLADAGIEVAPSLDDGTANNATVSLVLGPEKAKADEPELERDDLAGDLERLSSLFRDGLLTEDEFNSAKRRLLDS